MDEILAQIKSPAFIVCTVIGSILLNVLSHYIIRILEKTTSYMSVVAREFWDPRALRREARWRKIERWIEQHENGAVLLASKAMSLKFDTAVYLAAAAYCFFFARFVEHKVSTWFLVVVVITAYLYTLIALATTLRWRRFMRVFDRHEKGLDGLKEL
jgi:hypothetical protein